MVPVGEMRELPSYKGYFLDEEDHLFTHWRIVWAERQEGQVTKRYIAKTVRTSEWYAVLPETKKRRHKSGLYCSVVRRKRLIDVAWLDILTEARCGPRPTYLATCLDGDESNLQPHNLAWLKKEDHQNILRGEVVKKGKLSYRQIKAIKKRLRRGEMAANLAREYCVTRARISQIKNQKEKDHEKE